MNPMVKQNLQKNGGTILMRLKWMFQFRFLKKLLKQLGIFNDVPQVVDTSIVSFKRVTFKYPSQKEWQLNEIGFSVYSGQKVGIVGSNGCGKTTFVKVLIGICKPQMGVVKLFGENSRWTNHYPNAGYIGDPGYSTEELGLPHDLKVKAMLDVTVKLNEIAEYRDLHENLRLCEIENKKVHELSTGQRKRLMAALTFMRNPALLILDEPFDGLDENIRVYVELRLKEYYEDPSKTIILISHNKAEIDSFSDNVFTLLDGKLVEVQQKKFHVEIEKSNQRSQFVLKSGQILKHLTTEMENAILLNETINFTLKPIEQ